METDKNMSLSPLKLGTNMIQSVIQDRASFEQINASSGGKIMDLMEDSLFSCGNQMNLSTTSIRQPPNERLNFNYIWYAP